MTAAGERAVAVAAVGEDHRGEGEEDWDGEVVEVNVQDVPVAPRSDKEKDTDEIPNRKSKKVQGKVVLGGGAVAGTLGEERQGGESEQEVEDGDRESEEVDSQVL